MPENSLSKLLCLFTLISLFLTATCRADENVEEIPFHPDVLLSYDSYGVSDGLSQSTVTSITEDDDGYIWIGTLNGLNRFDGKDFKGYYASEDSRLKSSYIKAVLYSSDFDKLFVATDEDLYFFDKNTEKFTSFGINENILNISKSPNSIILITDTSKYKIDKEYKINKFNVNIKNSDIKNITFYNNNVYIITYGNKLIYNGNIIANNVTSISCTKDNVYILKNNLLYSVSNDHLTKFSELTFEHIFSDKDEIYVTHDNTFYSVSNEKLLTLIGSIANVSSSNLILYKKLKNGILISNVSNGFIYIRESKNLIKILRNNKNPVWSIKNNENKIVITGNSKSIYVYDKNLKKISTYNADDIGAKSAVIVNNNLYIGEKSGLKKINITDNKIDSIINEPISAIKVFSNSIYVGTAYGLLYKLDAKSGDVEKKTQISMQNPIFDILPDNNDTYVASQDGLFIVTNDNVKNIFNNDIVFCITNKNSEIFFGTRSGIYKTQNSGNVTRIFDQTKKPIFSILTKNDLIVASSIKEVVLIDRKNNSKILLNTNYGSQSEYNTQGIISYNGGFLLGGNEGVSYIDTDKVIDYIKKHNKSKLPTIIDNLLIFNLPEKVGSEILKKPISKTNKIKLKYTDYPFTLTFASPNIDISKKDIEYNYKLKGLSDSWISSKGINSATYTNLSPGNYVFSIYATNPLTLEKGNITSLNIEVTPPWWLSIYSKAAYFLTASLILFMLLKAFLKKRETQRQIALSEERLKLSLWGSGDEMWDWDIESGKIFRSNIWGALEFPRDGQRSGKEGEESNIHPQDQERVREALNKHFYGETDHFEATYRVRSKTGEWLWILDRAKIVERDDKDHATRMTGTIKNISSFKTAEEQLRLFERAIENISEGVFILDTEFQFVELNEAACDITRSTREKTIGTTIHFSRYSDDYNKQIKQLLRQQGQWNTEIEAIRGDNSIFLMELTIDAIYDEQGVLTHYVGVFSDISHRKQQEEELRRLTNNDLLTGLPNRSNLQVTLENLVKKDHHHTLMILDLDNFKKINDSLGHQVGDELLCLVASRIANIIPKHTSLYRLGGDEFAILVDKNPDIGSSALIANDVIEAFNKPFIIADESLVVGVSIGIVLYPEDEQNEQALLRKADIAMYHAKSAGGNRYQFYSESLNRNALRQLEVESLIREGLKDDLFEVYFQPKISLRTGKLAGMEALVRLNHPLHGMIPPGEFIPLAEETGLIVEIGDLVLKKACFAAQKWREQNLFSGRVAVNLSSRQFALPDLQTRIESILRLTRLPAANLELEITEGTVIKQPEKAIKVMQQLTRMGISLALDDFGTGYSSLSYLKRFPIHTLKIDKAFVDDIDKSDRDLKMVDSIITIAHNMGLSVVGEGVEQTAQLNILRALNCEEIQGFIYSKAISESDFTEYLRLDSIEAADQQNGTN
ncbi:EAL domain-containing protein [Shewanella sp. A32]|uniref:EAL domain-containing protein n=1 Tax=Shewanella sp. A32 TaxID=3031327 RepID=UPI0023B8CD9A|nr:EAL domain-containing protein [Shewanella sp. A32]MDF0536042.1 EAL domain-containing protein [Shewanella sp. A32]